MVLWWTVAVVSLLAGPTPFPASALGAEPPGVASLIVNLRSGATLASERPDVVERPILPGSVMKLAAVAAALEAGTITSRTRILCTRSVVVDGHRLTCTHPDLHRPLTPEEALTHSCNVFVATLAARLSRASFDRALAGLGLPPSSPAASVQASALGIEGTRMPVRALIAAIARVANTASPPAWTPATLAVVRGGLRNAAKQGTAAALGAAGIDALAKTGTVDGGGVSQGLVVGVTPPANPTTGFALIVSGGGGADAASLMATRLRQIPAPALAAQGRGTLVRVGVASSSGGYSVRNLTLDEYVAGVVAGEAAAGSPPASLDALAITVRTYTLANLGRHAAAGFDLCDLTHCQVLRSPTSSTRAAAARTSGRYLSDGASPAQVYYTASCGGFSERAPNVWKAATDSTYLPAKADPACEGEPAWRTELSARDLLLALRAGGFRGDALRNMAVTQRTASGRVAWLRVDGMSPPTVSGDDLRTLVGRHLGWQHLRSTLFEIERTGAGFRFSGHGAGHGVGLCVIGAAARGRGGDSAEAILRNYFPGLLVRTLDSTPAAGNGDAARTGDAARRHNRTGDRLRVQKVAPGQRVPTMHLVLSAQDEGRRPVLTSAAARAWQQMSALLDVPSPSGLVLRFHPTVESYQRATALPWYTAGATRGTTVDLLPPDALIRRGLLESTLRHEAVHALIGAALEGAPVWMQEGVAVWASQRAARGADDDGQRPSRLAQCPADAEFGSARSADALRQLYDAAAQCYARELAEGRNWRTWATPAR